MSPNEYRKKKTEGNFLISTFSVMSMHTSTIKAKGNPQKLLDKVAGND